MVLATVTVWYVGDSFYNDYKGYQMLFGSYILTLAWWEVLLFVVAFGLLVRPIHRRINRRLLGRRSAVVQYLGSRRLEAADIQGKLDLVCYALLAAWVVLYLVAIVRVQGDVIGLFAPYLGAKADPWSRTRIGTGFDSMISLASNFQIFLAASFGVLAAVARNPRTRTLALVVCALTLPYYIFDRTRNTMLATILPGMLAWIFFRLRGGLFLKFVALAVAFLMVHYWFSFVMANRTERGIAAAFVSTGGGEELNEDGSEVGPTKSGEGLNMFEELSYINAFTLSGMYTPNWGARYFAELVNPIPRALWPGKPLIGVDYALLRGQGGSEADEDQGGIFASISTGMIGQGVVNFGGFLGPIAAAILMSLWVALLARQDMLGEDPGHFLLYGSGMILTFNMGRDITLLVVYPFFFGLALLWAAKKLLNRNTKASRPAVQTGRPRVGATPTGGRRFTAPILPANGPLLRGKP